jgi:PHD/YefM family antitoxin component YafN of YafNO toxin-antitoxin module
MYHFHPQYIKDADGKESLVVLPAKEFERLIEELEDLEDVRAYDAAKAEDDGEPISYEDYLKKREARRQDG